MPMDVNWNPLDVKQVTDDFHDAHERAFGFKRTDQTVELVNIWVSMEMDSEPVRLPECPSAGEFKPVDQREVVFRGRFHTTPVYRRDAIGARTRLRGPCVVEQLDSTTIVWPEQEVQVDSYGQLRLGPMPAGFC